jgi:hypothetical protein
MHSDVPPDLRGLDVDTVLELAYAAHKYVVYYAMQCCVLALQYVTVYVPCEFYSIMLAKCRLKVKDYSRRIIPFAAQYRDMHLLDALTDSVLSFGLDEAEAYLENHPDLFRAWVRAIPSALFRFPTTDHSSFLCSSYAGPLQTRTPP